MKRLELLLTPAEFEQFRNKAPEEKVCVVFDILRATSSIVTGLGSGVREFLPALTIQDALDLHASHPDALLAGERGGLRIGSKLTGGVSFDLGNSPREYLSGEFQDRSIVITTTNGTRALRACLGAKEILIASFLNLSATSEFLVVTDPEKIVMVASGTGEQTAYEDILAAGALVNLLAKSWNDVALSDAALLARRLFLLEEEDLTNAFLHSCNGKNLSAHPQLLDDIAFCAQLDRFPVVAHLEEDGVIRVVSLRCSNATAIF